MKKIKKLAVVFLAGILTASVTLVGCGDKKPSVDETARAIYNLYVLSDPTEIKRLGVSEEEVTKVADEQKSASKNATKMNINKAGLQISEDQLNQIYDAQMEALKKLTVMTEVVEETEDTAKVKIITNFADFMTADKKAGKDAAAKIKESQITDKTKVVEIYVNNMINNLKAIEPSSEKKEDIFELKLQKIKTDGKIKDIWMPTNMTDFGTRLGKMITGQE